MGIPIHYIEIKKDKQNVPEELIVLRYGASAPTHIPLRQVKRRHAGLAGIGKRASLDPDTGALLRIAAPFI